MKKGAEYNSQPQQSSGNDVTASNLWEQYLVISEVPDDAGDAAGIHAIIQTLYEMGDTLNDLQDVLDSEE